MGAELLRAFNSALDTAFTTAFDSAFEYAPIGMAVLTPTGVIAVCNPAMGALLGRRPVELVGSTFLDVTHPDDLLEARHRSLQIQHDQTPVQRCEYRFLHSSSATVWVSASTARVPELPGRPSHLIAHVEDISDRKALEAELLHQATHDPLTGLGNRMLLTQKLARALTGGQDHARPSCLLYLDLNGFKAVNDHYGHTTGDRVLCELAERISALLRPQDVAARLGGDEFAILCVDMTAHHAPGVAARLRAAAARPFHIDGHAVSLSAAVGISTSDPSDLDTVPAALLRRADEDMYLTKRTEAAAHRKG